MLSPRLTNCPECANIPSLLKKIDCKLAELGNSLYNNISYMLNKPVPAGDIAQLIGYRRILMYKYCNPNYVQKYTVPMIASRVIRLTAGCVSKCNEPERCLEDPCDIKIVPNPTTTSTSTIAPSTTTTSTTVVPSTTTSTTTVTSTQWIMFASFNPYSACQQIDGENVTVYTSTSFLGNGVTLYLDEALTIPYVSNPFTNNVLSDGVNQYFLGDNGGGIIINSGSCQGFTTTTTSSSSTSTTTSTSSSTTTTSSSSTTTTTTGIPFCVTECLPLFSKGTGVFIYKNFNIIDLTSQITGPIPVTGDVANTSNKLWLYTQSDISEYNINGFCPFSATYNKNINLASGFFGSGMTSIDDVTLVSSIGTNIVQVDVATTTAGVTIKFPMPTNRDISGDLIYTTTNELICSYVDNITSNTYITIHDYSTGAILKDVNISSITYPWGLYLEGGIIHVCDNNGQIFSLNLDTEALTLVENVGQSLNGASQAPECAILNPITTTTSSSTSTTTSTTTAAPVSSILGVTAISPIGITIDSSNNIYVCNFNSNNLTKITPGGVSTNFGTTGNKPMDIAIDSLGNLYTANYLSNDVSKIEPDGTSTILGTTGSNPYSIVIDSADNIYVSNLGSDNVTKITPAGVSTTFATTGNGPAGIAIDSLGNIYTANLGSNNVSKITPSGVSTILGSTLPGVGPRGITVDSSGNVYTTNEASNNVTKITPSGVSTILANVLTNPYGIVLDSLDNLYVVNRGNDNVSKITPAGISTVFGITGSGPHNITIDPSGNLYVPNFNDNNVTKITV